jgi:hypothetical protein
METLAQAAAKLTRLVQQSVGNLACSMPSASGFDGGFDSGVCGGSLTSDGPVSSVAVENASGRIDG